MRAKLLISLAILLAFAACKEKEVPKAEVERVPVEVTRVKRATISRKIEAVGNVKPRRAVIINPKVSAKIEAIYVDEGDRVKKGQEIVRLEQTDFLLAVQRAEAALESARAALRQAEVNYENTKKDYRRLKALFEKKVISQQEFDHIEAAYRSARAQLALARARVKEAEVALKNAKVQLRDTVIRAPFDGFVTARFVDPGQRAYTMPPTNIMEIADISEVKISIDVPEREFPFLKIGTPVEVQIDALPGRRFRGRVTSIFPKVDPRTRTFRVEVTLKNPEGLLKPGMFCRVSILAEKVQTLVIPREAVLRMPATGVDYCFVVKEGKVYRRNIKTGLKEGNLVEVKEGLSEGEEVVISGQANLKAGMEVEVKGRPSGV